MLKLIPRVFLLVALSAAPVVAQEVATTVDKPVAWLRESHTTADFLQVQRKVEQLIDKHSAELVLLVVDIDNTMLAMDQPLGSDQWFAWQEELLRVAPNCGDLVAPDFPGLLDVQGALFSLSRMHPPEPGLPAMIRELQDRGVATVVLTSRGPAFRDAAERELARSGYDFDRSAVEIDEKRGAFMPFDPRLPDAHGLSAEIIDQIKSRLQPVTYANGIYMTSGQHKGYMLRTLLTRAVPDRSTLHESRIFRAVVFVDDHQKHTDRVQDAFAEANLDLATFRYSREDGNVSAFEKSNKRHVVDDWNRLREVFDAVLVR